MTHPLSSEQKEILKKQRMLQLIDQEIDFFEKSITAAANVSKEYNKIIETAKTSAKKKLYTKKLKRNNQLLVQVLVELEKANLIKKQIQEQSETTEEPTND